MSSQRNQTWLRSPISSQDSHSWLRSLISSQGGQAWLRSPLPERGDTYVSYVGREWRYQRGGQNPSIEKGQTTNHKMTNNDQHKSSPISALSVIRVWQYERVQLSRTLFLFLVKFLYVWIPIQNQIFLFKNSELSVLSVLNLDWYSKQLNNCHSSVIIQTKYNISMNQLFTVFVKDPSRSQIIQ